MVQKRGVDSVTMFLVPETMAAKQLGIDILGISYITNMAAEITKGPITHQEVLHISSAIEKKIFNLISGIIKKVS
jgi:purine-nucleoside phosphorylase